MKYEVKINGAKFNVDGVEFGVDKATATGNIGLYIRLTDNDYDIYDAEEKKSFWTEWVNICCADNGKPEDRVRKVEVGVFGGQGNNTPYRTIVIEKGYLAAFTELSDRGQPAHGIPGNFEYSAVIKSAPNKAGEISVKAG